MTSSQSVLLTSDEDLSGTIVTSDRPVVLLSGNGGILIDGDGKSERDESISQMFPASAWGREYVLASAPDNFKSGYVVRIGSGAESGTVVTGDGQTFEIKAYEIFLLNVTDNEPLYLEASVDIQVSYLYE